MSMDLLRPVGEPFNWNIYNWSKVLQLATEYGWIRQGTTPMIYTHTDGDSKEAWCGTYYSNDRQKVSAEDALALAEALQRALPDIPDCDVNLDVPRHGTEENFRAMQQDGGLPDMSQLDNGYHLELLDWFSGEQKDKVKSFIEFCRDGAFYIG